MNKEFQGADKRRQIRLANSFRGPVCSQGLALSTVMGNRFNSNDGGVVINLGDNPDEILYIGQVR